MHKPTRRDFLHWTSYAAAGLQIEHLGLSGAWLLGACAAAGGNVFRGVDASSGEYVTLAPRPLPYGATFAGRYRSPQLGELVLKQAPKQQLDGRYCAQHDGYVYDGTLHGTLTGNHCEFSFEEHVASRLPCEAATLMGRGFFLLDVSDEPGSCAARRLFGVRTYDRSDSAKATHRYQTFSPDARPFTAFDVHSAIGCSPGQGT